MGKDKESVALAILIVILITSAGNPFSLYFAILEVWILCF